MLKTTQQNSSNSTRGLCCTWQEDSDCKHCSLQGQLHCKWELKLVLHFFFIMVPTLIVIFVAIIYGAIYIRDWWWLGIIIGYFTLFFVVETRILCSHCPFYSKEGIILHCLVNYGFIKFFTYNPGPLNKFEKVLLTLGFLLFALIPLSSQIYNIFMVVMGGSSYSQTLFNVIISLFAITIILLIGSFTLLFTLICSKCVNFSCPFNKSTNEKIDEFLRKNPQMKDAWIKCGYSMKK